MQSPTRLCNIKNLTLIMTMVYYPSRIVIAKAKPSNCERILSFYRQRAKRG